MWKPDDELARLTAQADHYGVDIPEGTTARRGIVALRAAIAEEIEATLKTGDRVIIGYPHSSWGEAVLLDVDPHAKTRNENGRLVARKPLLAQRVEDGKLGWFHYPDVAEVIGHDDTVDPTVVDEILREATR